jgi:hypothetical protein
MLSEAAFVENSKNTINWLKLFSCEWEKGGAGHGCAILNEELPIRSFMPLAAKNIYTGT